MSNQGNSTSSSSPPSGGSSSPPSGVSSSPPSGGSSSPPSNEPPPPSSSSSSSSSPPPPSPNQSPPPPTTRNNDNSPQLESKNNAPPPPSKSTSGSSSNENSHSPPPPPPPPPPPGSHSKSLPSSHPKESSSPSDNFLSNEKAIIGGAAAGGGLLLLMMIVCLICCCKKRRKRKRHEKMQQYYRDNAHTNIGNDYFNSGGWNNHQQNSHEMRMPPSGQVSSEYNWSIQPPPPPPMMSSTELGSRNFSGTSHPPQPPPMSMGFNQSSFTYDDLASATGGFASTNMLGQGGFGYVYKGVLPNGKEVAVKSLKANSGQGEREFQAEVDIISRVHHRHLVSLVGYCIAGNQRMLVYEFVENDTLENRLHGKGHPPMDWPTRLDIALGSAKGFAYLHEDCHPRIIHRDIKASNILLDDKFEAKVADFGLAKLSSDTNTHVSTRIMGTFGYLAPEYASSGKLTEKSDIYSYGVVLLELITGKRPVDIHSDDDSLVDWARPILSTMLEGDHHSFGEVADPLLEGNYDPQEMLRMIASAAACIRHSARRRPKMSQIVRALEGDASLDDLNDVVRSSASSSAFGSRTSSTEHDDLKKYKKTGASSSQEFSSGEHGTIGEFHR